MHSLLRPFLWLVLALSPTACANLNLYSDEQLDQLSLQAYQEATDEHGQVTSGPQYQMVQRVAARITAACDEDFPWQTRLLKADDTPNAFCLPNGRIAIYTGILPITQDEDGLAIVMGHEVAHAVLRHGGKRMTQGTLTNVALAAAQAGLGLTEMSSEAQAGVMAALGVGAQVGVLLPYSRDHETEADVEGLRYAIRAGYDPYAAPALWERMAQIGGDEGMLWFRTHPHSADRAAMLREMIPTLLEQERGWQPGTPPGGTKQVEPGAIGR